MVPTVPIRERAAMSSEKRRQVHEWHASCIAAKHGILVSSKADAFIDGVGTLLDIFPDPRRRTIRAFVHRLNSPVSVMEAIEMDWGAVGRDMWEAIRAHAHEATEEDPSNLITR
jgi:hypothetical protein